MSAAELYYKTKPVTKNQKTKKIVLLNKYILDMLTLNVPAHLDLCVNASKDGVTTSYTLDRFLQLACLNFEYFQAIVFIWQHILDTILTYGFVPI